MLSKRRLPTFQRARNLDNHSATQPGRTSWERLENCSTSHQMVSFLSLISSFGWKIADIPEVLATRMSVLTCFWRPVLIAHIYIRYLCLVYEVEIFLPLARSTSVASLTTNDETWRTPGALLEKNSSMFEAPLMQDSG